MLYYFHDPMCSWCWGFRPAWLQVIDAVSERVEIRYVLGGLAPDTDKPMPPSMQAHLQQTWRRIQQDIPGTQFNFDFWTRCSPSRSTYPACRAIIATRMQALVSKVHGAADTPARAEAYGKLMALCVECHTGPKSEDGAPADGEKKKKGKKGKKK